MSRLMNIMQFILQFVFCFVYNFSEAILNVSCYSDIPLIKNTGI